MATPGERHTLNEVLMTELGCLRPQQTRARTRCNLPIDRSAARRGLREIYRFIDSFESRSTASLSALCLSGGGIRSATFNLGVIQTLARIGLLGKFDYLSSVSGGGYIASWLRAWMHRRGVDEVVQELGKGAKGSDPLNIEPKPVVNLREYSNYLTPAVGLFSGDTWSAAATIARNLLLNWLVLVPLLAAVVGIPLLFLQVIRTAGISRLWPFWLAPGGGHGDLRERVDLPGATPGEGSNDEAELFSAALCAAGLPGRHIPVHRRSRTRPARPAPARPCWDSACSGRLSCPCWAGLLGEWLAGPDHQREDPTGTPGRCRCALNSSRCCCPVRSVRPCLRRRRSGGSPISTIIRPCTRCWCCRCCWVSTCWRASLFIGYASLNDENSYQVAGEPGIRSRISRNDADREWWSRLSGWVLLVIVCWVAVTGICLIGCYLPNILWGLFRVVTHEGSRDRELRRETVGHRHRRDHRHHGRVHQQQSAHTLGQ